MSTSKGGSLNQSTASSEGVTVSNNSSSPLPIDNVDLNKRIKCTFTPFVPDNIPLDPGLYPTTSIKNLHNQQPHHYSTIRKPQYKNIIPIENQSLKKLLQEYNNISKKIAQYKNRE